MPGAISRCATIIDDPSQSLKERRSAVNLIDDDKLANLGAQKCVGILETPLISWTLKVKAYRPRLPGRPSSQPSADHQMLPPSFAARQLRARARPVKRRRPWCRLRSGRPWAPVLMPQSIRAR